MNNGLDRIRFAERHGLTYEGRRSLYDQCGYPRHIRTQDYLDAYERGGVAGAIIDMPAETSWRVAPEVTGTDEEGGAFEVEWNKLVERMGLWGKFERLDRCTRLGEYGVLLIGVDDGGDLRAPVDRLTTDSILYLTPHTQHTASVVTTVENPRDERFGKPFMYRLTVNKADVEVHWSRVLHVSEGSLSSDHLGVPALRPCWNPMVDLDKIAGSSGEAFWQRVGGFLKINIAPDVEVGEGDIEELLERAHELQHNLSRVWAARGAELSREQATDPRPEEAATLSMRLIAAGARIPMRMLFGSETGERASTEDQKSFLGTMEERRTKHCEPHILRAFIEWCFEHGALPIPANGVTVVWPSLFTESETDIAAVSLSNADAASRLTAPGGNPLDLVEIGEDRRVWLRPTGERGELTPEDLEPPEPPAPLLPEPPAAEGEDDDEDSV